MSSALRRSFYHARQACNSIQPMRTPPPQSQHHPSPSPPTPTSTPSVQPQATIPLSSPPTYAKNETFRLPDGRNLGFKSYGDPSGAPAFFFHGSPSSRLEAKEWHAVGLSTSTHIIGVDRWAHGLSSPHPSPTLLSWPADILALSHHLSLRTFHVLGSSGGGPYALACAHSLPKAVLLGTGVVAGAAPPAAGMKDMALDRKFAFCINRVFPSWAMEKMLDVAVGNAARTYDQDAWDKHAEKLVRTLHPDERVYYAAYPVQKKSMLDCYREAFRQGSRGAVLDAKLILSDGRFELGHVRGKVRIWNGAGDVHVPVHAARWMAERLPHAELKEYDGETHLSVPVKHGEEILRELMGMGP